MWPSCSTMPSGADSEPRLPLRLRLEVGVDVHAGRVEPDEPGLAALLLLVDELDGLGEHLLVHRLHPLLRQRAGVLAALLAPLPEAAVVGEGAGGVRRVAVEHAARAEHLLELRVLRVVGVLGLLLGVQVVEVAEELVEAVDRRDELVAVAQVVLAELPGRVALRLEQVRDRRVLVGEPLGSAREADLQQAGADRGLAGDERRPPGRAALLGVDVGEDRPFLRDAVDVRRAVAHHPAVVGADVPQADVVPEQHQDVRLLAGRLSPRRAPARGTPRPVWRGGPLSIYAT